MKKYILTISFTIFSLFAYENTKGKIDMHGGKSDSLSSKGGFSSGFKSLGDLSNNKNDNKKFIKLEKKQKIEKIQEIEKKND